MFMIVVSVAIFVVDTECGLQETWISKETDSEHYKIHFIWSYYHMWLRTQIRIKTDIVFSDMLYIVVVPINQSFEKLG